MLPGMSFLKSLKREEINATTYRDFEDLQKRLEEFIENRTVPQLCNNRFERDLPADHSNH